ncbi:unnamed protein product, partial [Effrenium voratum]
MVTFGAHLLRPDQKVESLRAECSEETQRLVARVCFSGHCDEWSKYAMPRCRIFLGSPYSVNSMDFFTGHACSDKGRLLCPPGVPLALEVKLKAGSRSAGLWAAMMEGLLPGLIAARRTITGMLQDGYTGAVLERYCHEWLEQDSFRLGCPRETWVGTANRIIGKFLHDRASPKLGLPMHLCPTCCAEGAQRLRVVFLRSPFARLVSYFQEWQPKAGKMPFSSWVEEVLAEQPNRSLIRERDEQHVAPVFRETPRPDQLIFLLEDVAGSVQRVEKELCAGWGFCLPLPGFPGGRQGAGQRAAGAANARWTPALRRLVERRYVHD